MKHTIPSPLTAPARALDAWRCRRTVRAWQRQKRREHTRHILGRRLRSLPYWHTFGQFLYVIGFALEYTLIQAARALGYLSWLLVRGLLDFCAALLRPAVLALDSLRPTGGASTPRERIAMAAGMLGTALAAAGLWLAVRSGLERSYALRIELDGKTLGYVASEQVFEDARTTVVERIANARATLAETGIPDEAGNWEVWPTYTLAAGPDDTMSETELVNTLLQSTGGEWQEATAVYLDGELRWVCAEGDHLRSYLQNLLAPYRAPGQSDTRAEFLHSLRLVDGLYFADSVQPYSDVLEALWDEPDALTVRTIQRQTILEDIPFSVETRQSPEYSYGEIVTAQEGQTGIRRITQDVSLVDGVEIEVQTVGVETLLAPVTEIRLTGTQFKDWMYGSYNGFDFVWPVPEYRSMSRWMGGGHNGADIAAPLGTPVLAAAAGTVTTTYTWNGIVTQGDWNSYGNSVVIEHDGGYSTRYAHLNQYVVSEGEYVEQGQLIGYVGSTGYSTGAHLHFEMYGPQGRFSARVVFPDVPTWNQ